MKRFLVGAGLGAVAALVSHALGLDLFWAIVIGLGVAAIIWFRIYRSIGDALGDGLGSILD